MAEQIFPHPNLLPRRGWNNDEMALFLSKREEAIFLSGVAENTGNEASH